MAFSVNAFSQPVLNYNSSHSIGTTSILHITGGSTTALQQTGAAVTWNLSTNTVTPSGTYDIVNPSTTPFAAAYPTANVCFAQTVTGQGTSYTYLIDSVNSLHSLATGIGGATPTIWTLYDKILKFPFNYTNSFSSVRQSSTGSAEPFIRTYDSYGTLIINGKTYNNVVRVYKNTGNAVWFTTSPVWFPVIIQANSTTFIYNQPATFTDIQEQNNIGVSIYPNPVSESVAITIPVDLIGSDVIVYDALGRKIKTQTLNSKTSSINMTDFPIGVYFLKIGELTHKIIRQ